jgi:threonine synthase
MMRTMGAAASHASTSVSTSTASTVSKRSMKSFLTHLECTLCERSYPADGLQNLCVECSRPLYARYDLDALRRQLDREALRPRAQDLWRYAEMLPVQTEAARVTLGETTTPLVPCPILGREIGLARLVVKDESRLPTGSFKARGMAVAVSRAKELGAASLAAPSAGNAGGALTAYAARAALPCHVFMPEDVPVLNQVEAVYGGARTYLVRGLIHDCGRLVREGSTQFGWFDMSTLKEPYRVEGKKTMGLELAEQLGWTLPDVIVYPTGGGTGLVGMWKAFAELEALGWIGPERPRMIAVQSEGCAPIVRAFEQGEEFAAPWQNAATVASGLRVPAAVGDFLILRALRESGGAAVAVSEPEILAALSLAARAEGLLLCPEAGAALSGLQRLREAGTVRESERVVLFNTGTGLKYPEAFPLPGLPLLDPTRPLTAQLHSNEP